MEKRAISIAAFWTLFGAAYLLPQQRALGVPIVRESRCGTMIKKGEQALERGNVSGVAVSDRVRFYVCPKAKARRPIIGIIVRNNNAAPEEKELCDRCLSGQKDGPPEFILPAQGSCPVHL